MAPVRAEMSGLHGAERPNACLAVNDLLTSEKNSSGLFIDRMPTLFGQGPGQVGLSLITISASAVRDGVVVTHGSFLGDSLSQQIATGLQVFEVRFVSRIQLVLGRKIPLAAVCQFLGPTFGS